MSKALRLSDRIMDALELALEQEDVQVADLLNQAMELSMTRSSGGDEFIERRNYSDEVDDMMYRLMILKGRHGQED